MWLALVLIVSSCAGVTQPMYTEPATHGNLSMANESLRSLPEPEEKIVATVYRFRDQTGQYKPSDKVASWSTAVTQGATSILLKSMEDSGWFTTIEREGVSNLLNERQIIQNIRQQHSGGQQGNFVNPLLFAGVILEGGIIGYDTNIITGGAGARYLGIGGSGQYRKDQVTIYLRAVSTQSGRILKTVHSSKSIISQKMDGGVFKFVDFERLLEAEVGYTYNEPPVMAVTEAIDEAVKMLILEGIEEGIWKAKDEEEVRAYRMRFDYDRERQAQLERDYFGFISRPDYRRGWAVAPRVGWGSTIGNYANPDINLSGSFQVERSIMPGFSAKAGLERTRVSTPNVYSDPVNSAELMLNTYVLPRYQLSPFIGAGGGLFVFDDVWNNDNDRIFPFVGIDSGLDYQITNHLGLRVNVGYRYLLKDGIDGIAMGKHNDQYWNVSAGLVIRPRFRSVFQNN